MDEIHIDPKVHAVRELHCDLLTRSYLGSGIWDRLTAQATTIRDGHLVGNTAVAFHIGSWCPGLTGSDSDQIMASSFSMDQAQETIAKEHGFKGWSEVEALKGVMLDDEFEQTVDAVVHGDLVQLQKRLHAKPELVKQRSQYGHRATLLHYIGANGIESYRQITPLNALEVVRCLISAGADVNATAGMYGGNTTTLELVLTSAHPNNAGVATEVAEMLKAAGAS